MRIAVATGPIAGRAIQQSFTFHGDRDIAEARCSELAADYAMIFGITELIRTSSQLMALRPGDLVNTGTPAGVVPGKRDRNPHLHPGDVVALEIDGLGREHQTLGQA